MTIEKLLLRDFRNYAALELRPHPGVNLLFGQNGSGKTNLLEAVHFCALGRSHRTSADREVVRRGAEMGACGVVVSGKAGRSEISVKLTPGQVRKKQVFVDKKRAARLSDLMGRVRCVIFSPEDLMLVKEGPSVRRRYADMMLSQLSAGYFVALQQYQKALEQRNALLKEAKRTDSMPTALLDAFEKAMAENAALIIPMRQKMLGEAAAIAEEKYRAISGREGECFAMRYACCAPGEDVADQVARRLKEARREDMFRGTTGFGVHREDIQLTLNGREMKLYASQGQIRTAALSMKLAQLELFNRETGDPPILLLDDVMSELDMTRRKRLLEEIGGLQTFVTCTDESDLDGCTDRRSYRVRLDENNEAVICETSEGTAVAQEQEDEEPDFS